MKISLLKRITCEHLTFLMKVVRSRPRYFHLNPKMKLPHKTNMTSSEGTSTYRDKVDERPIRVDHGLIGERESEGSSVDGVSHEDVSELFRRSESSPIHPFCTLLNFTTEEGEMISHPVFSEEVVRDLCTSGLGRRHDKISRLSQTDYLVEFEVSDNPTLFAIKLGNKHMWLGMELHMDAHIGTAATLKRVSLQCEEACTKVDTTKMTSGRDVPTRMTSSEKIEIEKTPGEGFHEKMKTETTEGKEDAMLRVLESMSED